MKMFSSQFKRDETKEYFTNFDIKDIMDSLSMENADMMNEFSTLSGEELYQSTLQQVDAFEELLQQFESSKHNKRKMTKLVDSLPEEIQPLFSALLELDSSSVRSMLAAAVSSLKPIEQLMLNKVLDGDMNGFTGLWKQYLQQDGQLENIRQYLLPFKGQFPDMFADMLDDKRTFKQHMLEMFDAK